MCGGEAICAHSGNQTVGCLGVLTFSGSFATCWFSKALRSAGQTAFGKCRHHSRVSWLHTRGPNEEKGQKQQWRKKKAASHLCWSATLKAWNIFKCRMWRVSRNTACTRSIDLHACLCVCLMPTQIRPDSLQSQHDRWSSVTWQTPNRNLQVGQGEFTGHRVPQHKRRSDGQNAQDAGSLKGTPKHRGKLSLGERPQAFFLCVCS